MLPALTRIFALLILSLTIGIIVACGDDSDSGSPRDHLKIGLVLNFTDSPEASQARQKAFDFAIKQLNEAGGILGRPVEGFAVDATSDPDVALERVLLLVNAARVQAIVGPNASSASLPVARQVSGPRQIPTISPSATSPLLSTVEDNDFFFRTALSDNAQGPVLAQVNRDLGFDNVGLIYQNDAWGQGLAQTFQDAWTGQVRAVSVELAQDSFLPQLQESATDNPQSLVVIAFESVALPLVKEAVDSGLYGNFTFGDAAKRFSLVKFVGAEHLAGMHGTAGAPAPENDASRIWEQAFIEEYGSLPRLPYTRETYDAVMAIAFAAQAAGSLHGAEIRDHLRQIGSPPGQVVQATLDGIAEALELLSNGEEINYEGVAVSADWDSNGDLSRGYIGVWRFTPNADIEEVKTVLFEF